MHIHTQIRIPTIVVRSAANDRTGAGVGGVALRCADAAAQPGDARNWLPLGAPNLIRDSSASNASAFTVAEAFLNQPQIFVCDAGAAISTILVQTVTIDTPPAGSAPVSHGCWSEGLFTSGGDMQIISCKHVSLQVVTSLQFLCASGPPQPTTYASLADVASR